MNRSRGIAYLVAVMILISIAVIAGILLLAFMGGLSRPSDIASIEVVGQASLSSDKSEITVRVILINNGNVPLNVYYVKASPTDSDARFPVLLKSIPDFRRTRLPLPAGEEREVFLVYICRNCYTGMGVTITVYARDQTGELHIFEAQTKAT